MLPHTTRPQGPLEEFRITDPKILGEVRGELHRKNDAARTIEAPMQIQTRRIKTKFKGSLGT